MIYKTGYLYRTLTDGNSLWNFDLINRIDFIDKNVIFLVVQDNTFYNDHFMKILTSDGTIGLMFKYTREGIFEEIGNK